MSGDFIMFSMISQPNGPLQKQKKKKYNTIIYKVWKTTLSTLSLIINR
jgi:hypothetical protein